MKKKVLKKAKLSPLESLKCLLGSLRFTVTKISSSWNQWPNKTSSASRIFSPTGRSPSLGMRSCAWLTKKPSSNRNGPSQKLKCWQKSSTPKKTFANGDRYHISYFVNLKENSTGLSSNVGRNGSIILTPRLEKGSGRSRKTLLF